MQYFNQLLFDNRSVLMEHKFKFTHYFFWIFIAFQILLDTVPIISQILRFILCWEESFRNSTSLAAMKKIMAK